MHNKMRVISKTPVKLHYDAIDRLHSYDIIWFKKEFFGSKILSRILNKIIDIIKPDYNNLYTKTIYTEIDSESVVEYIIKNVAAHRKITRIDIKYIIVGNDVMTELCMTAPPGLIQITNDEILLRTKHTIFGMDLIVCPWMDGILFLPEIN